MTRGRPLRFLALVLGGWTTARVAMLWPTVVVPDAQAAATNHAVVAAPARLAPIPVALITWPATRPHGARTAFPGEGRGPGAISAMASAGAARALPVHLGPGLRLGGAPKPVSFLDQSPSPDGGASGSTTSTASQGIVSGDQAPAQPFAIGSPDAAPRPRLALSSWLIARGSGSGDSLAFGQLGASQAGARATYALDAARRVALSARLSTPLRGRGREAGVGIDWQPTRLPVHLLAEERISLDNGSARPAVQLIAGTAAHLPLHFALDGYAQGGAIRDRGGFADGAAHLLHPLASRRALRLDAGVGAWGAAQRGAARVDVGPTAGVTLPVGGGSVRLAVDYGIM